MPSPLTPVKDISPGELKRSNDINDIGSAEFCKKFKEEGAENPSNVKDDVPVSQSAINVETPQKLTMDLRDAAVLAQKSRLEAERREEKRKKEEEKQAEKVRKLAEKQAEKERKEAEKQAERDKKEAEKQAERDRKEAEKQAERDRKEAEKLAEKERKEAEKERKEAEKQAEKERKEAEKLAEKERKEAEKFAEKEKQEAEKLKAQPRINSFFKLQPAQPPPVVPTSTLHIPQSDLPSSSGPEDDVMGENLCDYDIHILPFQRKLGGEVFSSTCNIPFAPNEPDMNPTEWLHLQQQRKNTEPSQAPKLSSQLFQKNLALACESSQISDLLTQIRIRRLQFAHLNSKYLEDASAPINEEFRPPFVGMTPDNTAKFLLAQEPLRTDLDPSLNYEYDSEIEWENEDGDDLRDEDGDDSDEDFSDQEELKEFLSSDEDDVGLSKPKLVGPLTPVVIWGPVEDLATFAMEMLSGLKCIDPTEEAAKTQTNSSISGSQAEASTNSHEFKEIIDPICKKIGFQDLKSELMSHAGSTGTKTLIVELLKQQFSMVTAQEIRQLFDICMERVGKKRNEKRWLLTDQARKFFELEV